MLEYLRWIYQRSLVIDGNFKLDNLKMRQAEDDVRLSDGEAFMVTSGPYHEHINAGTDLKEVRKFVICDDLPSEAI